MTTTNSAPSVPRIPVEDFFRNSERTGYQISPDGRYFSYFAPYADRQNLFVQPVDGGEAVRLTSETERSLAGSIWANDHRLLFMKDTGGDENYKLFGVDLDGTDLRAYTDFEGVRTQLIDPLDHVDDEVIVGLNRRNPEVFDPYRLRLSTGELTLLAENPGNVQGWMTDHAGRLRAATAIVDGVNTQLLYRDTEDEPFRVVLTTNFKETVSFVDFTPDNRLVYALTNLGRDTAALVLMDPRTCQELEVLFEHPHYDVASISYSERRQKLLSACCVGHKGVIRHYFDAEEEAIRARLMPRFAGYEFGTADWDRSERKRLIYSANDRTRGRYTFYDADTDRLEPVAELAPWLDERAMAAMHPVTYTTRDGLTIEAYLTLPAGLTPDTARRVPVVVHPHGGPWARDTWGYNPEVQFLANRGYAVFQMNFRASTGYGRRFNEAGFKQWGRAMQDDITDGVRWLVGKGIADPARVAIYGASYGGYAALAGVTFTPDLYCCAVDYVGVSNLLTFMRTVPPYWKPMLDMMYEMVGDPVADREMMEACSPALHADRIVAPLLIAQGANDPRVNKAESDQMVEALRARGVEVEYMVKDNEGHGFSNQENKFDFYRAMERFLERYLGPAVG